MFFYPDKTIFRYHPLKLELETLAGTIAAVTPTSGPNIYNHSVRPVDRPNSRLTQKAVQNYMWCCPALYITPPSDPAGGLF